MRLLSYEDLKAKGVPYTKGHLWRMIRAEKFPKPVKLGEARNAWVETEIDEWIKDRVVARDNAVAA